MCMIYERFHTSIFKDHIVYSNLHDAKHGYFKFLKGYSK